MSGGPSKPSHLARSLCECLQNSEIAGNVKHELSAVFPGIMSFRIALLVTPKGESENVMAFFGDFCRPGIPRVCLLSPQCTVAGVAVTEGRPVLASVETSPGYTDFLSPLCLAVPFRFTLSAGPTTSGCAVLLLGTASREAPTEPRTVRHLMLLALALQSADVFKEALVPLIRHVSVLLETQGAEDADPDLLPEDLGDGVEEAATVLDAKGWSSGSCAEDRSMGNDSGGGHDADDQGPSAFTLLASEGESDAERHYEPQSVKAGPSETGWEGAATPTSRKLGVGGAGPCEISELKLGTGVSTAGSPSALSDSTSTGPMAASGSAESETDEDRLIRWRSTTLRHLDGFGLITIATALASHALLGGEERSVGNRAVRLVVGGIGAVLLVCVARYAQSNTSSDNYGRARLAFLSRIPREELLAGIHIALTVWLCGGGRLLSSALGLPSSSSSSSNNDLANLVPPSHRSSRTEIVTGPVIAWLASALLLCQTRYASLARWQIVVAALGTLLCSIFLGDSASMPLVSKGVNLARLTLALLVSPLALDAIIDSAVRRAFNALPAERGGPLVAPSMTVASGQVAPLAS